jgi:hypothetical protein
MSTYKLAGPLLASGLNSYDLLTRTRAGTLERIRRGVYVEPAARDLETTHRILVESSLELGRSDSVVSFGSAAVVHGLPVWPSALDKVHLTRSRTDSGRIRRLVHVHVAALGAADLTTVGRIPVTSLSRTFVDHARTVALSQAVAAGDRALHLGMDMSQVQDQLEAARARRGIGRARYAASLLDGASESAGESLSRVTFIEAGLPAPQLQDFLWPEYGTVGEFDGKVKYGRLLRQGETAADAVFREKLREDAIRDLGYQVVRWTWDDLFTPGQVFERLRRAFVRGHRVII